MMPASYRVSWAARGSSRRGPLALAFVGLAAGCGGVMAGSGMAGARLGMSCAGLLIASMLIVNFPAPGHRHWSEFELSLPLGLRELVRARLVLALAVWLAPVVVAFGLGAAGVIPAPAGPAAAIVAASAAGSVVLAAVAREVLGLPGRGVGSGLGRGLALLVGAIGFVAPAAWLGPALLLVAFAWWRSALASAPAAFELQPAGAGGAASPEPWREPEPEPVATEQRPARAGSSSALAQHEEHEGDAVGALLRRYTLGGLYPITLLVFTFLWAAWVELVDPTIGPLHALFVLQWSAYHAGWSARLLRLEPWPLDRERLFRYVVWPALIAFALGSGVAMATGASLALAKVDGSGRQHAIESSKRYWRFAGGEVPIVAGPDGEAYRPEGRPFGLGSALVAYDPYEAGAETSHAFQVHQLDRLLREQYGVALSAEQLDARLASGHGSHRRLSSDAFPELRGQLRRESAARIAALSLGILLTLFFVIYPGHARNVGRGPGQRRTLGVVPSALILVAFIGPLVPILLSRLEVDVSWMLAHAVVSSLADHLALALPVALALAAALYRTLQQRFRRMEAPLRATQVDSWFIEV
jgi:hypothetical protein